MTRTKPALDALSTDEKAAVLDGLLSDRPDLRELAETYAMSWLADEDREAVAGDVERRGKLGMSFAAVELAMGILLGLQECRDASPESLLEYSPDYAANRASRVADQCQQLGIELPSAELLDLLPKWHKPFL